VKGGGGGENCLIRSFVFILLAKYNCNDPVKENEMVCACSINRAESEGMQVGKQEGKIPPKKVLYTYMK
jgi:hypothetical protein